MLKEKIPERLLEEEGGGFLVNVIFIGTIVAIIAVLFIDGTAVYSTYARVGEVTNEAARQADLEYRDSHNPQLAEMVATEHCEDNGMEFVEFDVLPESGFVFTVTCASEADTLVFKHLPFLKDLIHQEVSANPGVV